MMHPMIAKLWEQKRAREAAERAAAPVTEKLKAPETTLVDVRAALTFALEDIAALRARVGALEAALGVRPDDPAGG